MVIETKIKGYLENNINENTLDQNTCVMAKNNALRNNSETWPNYQTEKKENKWVYI